MTIHEQPARWFRWIEDLRRDVPYGARTLAKTPAFTVTATLTLALGIAAVTVIYSVVRNVVLDPFPYSRSDRLVNVLMQSTARNDVRGPYFPAGGVPGLSGAGDCVRRRGRDQPRLDALVSETARNASMSRG